MEYFAAMLMSTGLMRVTLATLRFWCAARMVNGPAWKPTVMPQARPDGEPSMSPLPQDDPAVKPLKRPW